MTYSDELDFEESDFETSLFPMQCYGNFKKSKKIVRWMLPGGFL